MLVATAAALLPAVDVQCTRWSMVATG